MTLEFAAEPDPPQVAAILGTYHGKLAFDVGANVGQSARVLAKRFESVIAIEPCEESFVVLRDSVPGNVLPVHVAATDVNGHVDLYEQSRHLARGQLTTREGLETVPEDEVHGWGEVLGTRQVVGATLDYLATIHDFPDMLKIDVEGHELRVLRGATEVLSRRPALYIEVHNEELGRDCLDLLRDVYPVPDSVSVVRHPHYRPGDWGYDNHYWMVAS